MCPQPSARLIGTAAAGQPKPRSLRGFTLIELLVVIGIIGILSSMLMPALGRAKGAAHKTQCINNQRQLAMGVRMYIDENQGRLIPRQRDKLWPTVIVPILAMNSKSTNLALFRCPTDLKGATSGSPLDTPETQPAAFARRSYVINGWNDYYRIQLKPEERKLFRTVGSPELVMRETEVQEPSNTCLFGEKNSESPHFHMDFEDGDDVFQLDQNRHGNAMRTGRGGGSNYAMLDGSVQFFRFGKTLSPVNLWAVTPEARQQALVSP